MWDDLTVGRPGCFAYILLRFIGTVKAQQIRVAFACTINNNAHSMRHPRVARRSRKENTHTHHIMQVMLILRQVKCTMCVQVIR